MWRSKGGWWPGEWKLSSTSKYAQAVCHVTEQGLICLLTDQCDLCNLLYVLNAGTDSRIGENVFWKAKENIISCFEFLE